MNTLLHMLHGCTYAAPIKFTSQPETDFCLSVLSTEAAEFAVSFFKIILNSDPQKCRLVNVAVLCF